MPRRSTLPKPGHYVLITRDGRMRDLALIRPPRGSDIVTIWMIFRREDARRLLTQLGADPNFIPEEEYMLEDDFFETPRGAAHLVAAWRRDELDDLLYRGLRRELNADAKARGLTRATSWRDVADQRHLPPQAARNSQISRK